MRAFLAVLPPASVIEDLDEFLHPRRLADGGGRGDWHWSRPHQMHLTLAFMGDLPEHDEEPLVQAGSRWAARQSPLELTLAGGGAFPDPGCAKVLWVGADSSAAQETLSRWSRELRDLSNHEGAQVDGMRFTAHVTVARSRVPRSAGRWVQALDGYRSVSFEVSEVALVQSHLGQGPGRSPRYVVHHRFTLGAEREAQPRTMP